jgi:hypothetical protein
LIAGTHFPNNSATVTFYANWLDSAPPTSAVVRVDGIDHPMVADRGSGGNVTLSYATSLDGGCHGYLFAFDDSTGQSFLLPGTGSYQAGNGCASDYVADTGPGDGGTDGGSGASKGSGCSQGGALAVSELVSVLCLGLLVRRRRTHFTASANCTQ